jgi:predicted GNAT family acetyltransferase
MKINRLKERLQAEHPMTMVSLRRQGVGDEIIATALADARRQAQTA